MRRLLTALCALPLALTLTACDPAKDEIIAKAEGAGTKAELRAALGDPDEVDKLGPVETWTYAASDGSVSFVIAGDTVTLTATGGKAQQGQQ